MEEKHVFLKRFSVFLGAKSIGTKVAKGLWNGNFPYDCINYIFFGVWFFFFEDDLGALFGFDAGAIQWPFAVVLLLHHSDNHL